MESRQTDQNESKLNVTENDSEKTEIKPITAFKIKKRAENGQASKKVQFYSLPPISDDKRNKNII